VLRLFDPESLIHALPAEHNGEAITWQPWEEAGVALCGRTAKRNTCAACQHPGPRMVALGVAGIPAVTRAYGHHCPTCQETRVYWRSDPPAGSWKGRLDLISYSPPRTITGTGGET
jgi:hypothetical protein